MTAAQVDRWRAYAYRAGQNLSFTRDQCDDLAQDCLVEILYEEGMSDAWIKRMVQNKAIDALRALKRLNAREMSAEALHEPICRHIEAAVIDDIISRDVLYRLPQLEQEILTMHSYGMTDTEIASEIGISTAAVKQRRHAIRRRTMTLAM